MAVLVEACSVIVRCDAIAARLAGGWEGFCAAVPNGTLCWDGDLARVGFMAQVDAEAYIETLKEAGLVPRRGGEAADIALVHHRLGSFYPAPWLQLARLPLGESGGKVLAGWLYEGEQLMGPDHIYQRQDEQVPRGMSAVVTPPGWSFEGSLSDTGVTHADGSASQDLRFLRHEQNLDVFLDLTTGKEVFVGRTAGASDSDADESGD
jgi:hypothetical protein